MKKLDNFKIFNRICRINCCVQVFLIALLMYGIPFTLSKYFIRFDFSKNHENALSPETEAYLQTLKQPITFTFINESGNYESPFFRHFNRLAMLYQGACSRLKVGPFKFHCIDSLRNPKEMLQLHSQYDLSDGNGILVQLGKHAQWVSEEDLYSDNKKEFLGEQVLSNILVRLANGKTNIIYWSSGHCEYDYKNVHSEKGASLASKILKQHNYEIKPLPNCLTIPNDADMVVIFGPQLPFLPEECTALKNYLLQRHGRLLIALQPVYEHGLDSLLQAIGLQCPKDILLDDSNDVIGATGDVLIRRIKDHEITHAIIQKKLGLMFGLIRPILKDNNFKNQHYTTPLLFSSESSWIKSDLQEDLSFDPSKDKRQTYVLAYAFDNSPKTQLQLKIANSKAIVVGCADWLANSRLTALGNRWFFINSIKWALESEDALILKPIPLKTYTLSLSQQQFLLLCLNFSILPFVFLILGIIVIGVRKE